MNNYLILIQNKKRSRKFFFFSAREQKNGVFSRLFWIPETFLNERNVAKGVEGSEVWSGEEQGVRSEGGVPSGVPKRRTPCESERKTERPETTVATWSEWRKRRRDPKTVERTFTIFLFSSTKNKKTFARTRCSTVLSCEPAKFGS